MSENKDELIEAQKQVIAILFEVVKRQQANNDLDSEYFKLASKKESSDKSKLNEITVERKKNAEIIGNLLQRLETSD